MSYRYVAPNWITRRIFNPFIALLMRAGLSVRGSRVLAVRGRRSGEWRTTPVNVLIIDGEGYLVSPRGVTDWVRNLRASGQAELRLGRGRETILAFEITDDRRIQILREYLRRWSWEVGQFFEGVGPSASDVELAHIAPNHPVFELRRPPA
jgi:deazaflavin-dependent oxidoreductase (nitroreductase family)